MFIKDFVPRKRGNDRAENHRQKSRETDPSILFLFTGSGAIIPVVVFRFKSRIPALRP